jgi:hypothetical protein
MKRLANARGPDMPYREASVFSVRAVRKRLEEGFGCNIQHQCVRPDPDVSRCSMVRA